MNYSLSPPESVASQESESTVWSEVAEVLILPKITVNLTKSEPEEVELLPEVGAQNIVKYMYRQINIARLDTW